MTASKTIDLRSDTVTKPTQAMREAMYKAEVGDDVFGDDPTVNRLEEIAAERMGKEAALFVPSGTMGNLISILTHCQRGEEIIVGDQAHIFVSEQGGSAALGGIHARTVRNAPDGQLALDEIEAAISDDDIHHAATKLICLENTWFGRVLPIEYLDSVAKISQRHNLKMHLDGARLFNASVYLNEPVARLARNFDSVQFCFSKGLSCPVGSMICSDTSFIKQARRNRKLVGGGMRQAGILAAACIVALEEMVDRLADDHVSAKILANGLAELPEIEIDAANVQTNIVLFSVKKRGLGASELVKKLNEQGIRTLTFGPKMIRAVIHSGITREDVELALKAFKSAVSEPVRSISRA
jgi:threonine aldolase